MKTNPLVSIIIPCYNGENFVYRLLNSIQEQTYSNIEVVFVNDGSQDKTEEIATQYLKKMNNRGMQCHYIYQENGGVCSAINRGLAIFHGDYIMYPNSDDWMFPDCVRKMVEYMEANREKGTVISKGAVVSEKNPKKVIGVLERKNTSSGWLFEDLVFGRDIYFGSAGWMTRAEFFLQVLPERKIYECRHGQNWQLYLPVLYKYESGFLEDVLWCYQIRDNSVEHQVKEFQDQIDRTYQYENILKHVLSSIEMPESARQNYLNKIRINYIHTRLQIAMRHHNISALREEYMNLRKENDITVKDKIYYLCGKYPLVFVICKAMWYPVKAIKALRRKVYIAQYNRKDEYSVSYDR